MSVAVRQFGRRVHSRRARHSDLAPIYLRNMVDAHIMGSARASLSKCIISIVLECHEHSGLGCIVWAWTTRNGGVTVSTGSFAVERHAGGWAPVIAYKNTIAHNQLALAA